mgnify:CR=1 FL=1
MAEATTNTTTIIARADQHDIDLHKASDRVNFGSIREPIDVPYLLGVQTDSFDWLIGNERWQKRVEEDLANGTNTVPHTSGLDEVFQEISPIENFAQTMSLTFSDPYFEEPRHTVQECKEKDYTYSAPLYVNAEFENGDTGEIKSQTVFMGDFPLQTPHGTFIIGGTERVIVSQLVRSPGVYFDRSQDRTSDKEVFGAKIIPSRGAWLEFEIDKRDVLGVRVDRKRKQSAIVFLMAIGMTKDEIADAFRDYPLVMDALAKETVQTQDEALTDLYRKIRPADTPTPEAGRNLLDSFYFNTKRYDLARVGRYKINRKLGLEKDVNDRSLSREDIISTIKYLVTLHAGDTKFPGKRDGQDVDLRVDVDDIDHFGNRRIRQVGELIQNQLRTGLSRMERVVRERMTTQDPGGHHPAVPDQHSSGERHHQGVLRNFPSCRSSWIRTTRWQASPTSVVCPLWALAVCLVTAHPWKCETCTRPTSAVCARSNLLKVRTSVLSVLWQPSAASIRSASSRPRTVRSSTAM